MKAYDSAGNTIIIHSKASTNIIYTAAITNISGENGIGERRTVPWREAGSSQSVVEETMVKNVVERDARLRKMLWGLVVLCLWSMQETTFRLLRRVLVEGHISSLYRCSEVEGSRLLETKH